MLPLVFPIDGRSRKNFELDIRCPARAFLFAFSRRMMSATGLRHSWTHLVWDLRRCPWRKIFVGTFRQTEVRLVDVNYHLWNAYSCSPLASSAVLYLGGNGPVC